MKEVITKQLHRGCDQRMYSDLYWSCRNIPYSILQSKISSRLYVELQRRLTAELEINLIEYIDENNNFKSVI